ncbi:MAG: hypothetical protein JWO98_4154 [Frankiales bacterium]|nr:hypothetical protein [Frankiales bacterium]
MDAVAGPFDAVEKVGDTGEFSEGPGFRTRRTEVSWSRVSPPGAPR